MFCTAPPSSESRIGRSPIPRVLNTAKNKSKSEGTQACDNSVTIILIWFLTKIEASKVVQGPKFDVMIVAHICKVRAML